ncbi:hypothetical protein ANN_15431 [Periplaneta americana]|uniref:Endonuclease/exonuclease/phosphatase domain-containing protein n=1 Tax=Periplaneta americana TaxID=6978 RepID=A0ABQ8SH20_PERAM|nr:hypothetical protein ANN_15431 [Periplaneta americana]
MSTIRRLNTIKVQFDSSATRPMAMDVHLWIQQTLKLNTEQVEMLQLNTQEKSLYIKVISPTIYEKLIHKHEGTTDFKYNNGEQTQVKVSKADVPSVTVRVFNLPPEVPSSLIQTVLNTYGVVHSVRQEQWSTAYPFPVNNGVRAVKMEIKKHIPGSIAIAGYNAHHKKKTDTASETEATKTLTTEDEQNIMDTTEYTANDAADRAQDMEQLAVIADDVEITNISSGIKTPLHLGESTLDLEENKIGQPTETTETPSKKLKPMAQNEFTRDPRLRSREDGAASGSSASEKNTSTTYPSNKVKNSPRPHPYAIYGRTKDGSKKDGPDVKSLPKEDKNEVNNENFDFIGPQYDYVVNTGDENRGTAVIYRCGLTVDAIEKHSSGRVISMKINNIQILNIYLPSGTNHRQQRESFLSKELPSFLRHSYDCLLIGGDWNCVLHAKDQTGQYNPSPTDITLPIYDKGSWKLNNALLHIPEISEQFSQHFEKLISKANKSKLNIMQKALYSASPTSATETDTLLKHVNRHLNLQQQHDLQLPITEEEILRAIETAPKNSAPGPDGLTYQLYKMQWNLIKDTLVDLFNYIFDRGIVVEVQ